MTNRGKYHRLTCSVHGKGHRFPKTIQETVDKGNRTELNVYKVCRCGYKKLINSSSQPKPGKVIAGVKCQNPFLKDGCRNDRIVLSIVVDGQTYPICGDCWKYLAESDKKW